MTTPATKVRRWTLVERAMVSLLVVGAVFGMAIAGTALVRQNAIRESQSEQACIARLTADFMAAVGDALGAPPAPNPARDEAVAAITRSADRLHRVDQVC